MTFTALSLGSNLGDRLFHIESMERALRSILIDGTLRSSRVMETEPVGVSAAGQPAYLNKVVAGYYGGSAYELLDRCLSIETDLGRTRPTPKAPRTADADILVFGNEEINDPPRLIIPHPELSNRRFCLEGLIDIDPSIKIRIAGRTLTAGELHENMGADVAAQKVSFC
ncbi:MAG: 2-amino-4-hydroxy-6-hydroxymethyldihydropteridine diphosphokinase [Chitinispirillales bacterium]|jgi:2-amino-4-hydroxy-6-hydroxymethyldihydropteridine diphosphokinase|nr:2-amino-4-hydroxy-6-hydroxymethyldihydropteridine diphosphokinase [Chitinispirillales bacterium]